MRGCADERSLGVLVLVLLGCSVSQDQEVDLGRRNAEQVNAQMPLVHDQIASQLRAGAGHVDRAHDGALRSRLAVPHRGQPSGERLRAAGRLHLREPRPDRARPEPRRAGGRAWHTRSATSRCDIRWSRWRSRRARGSPWSWAAGSRTCATARWRARRSRWAARRCSRGTAVTTRRRRTPQAVQLVVNAGIDPRRHPRAVQAPAGGAPTVAGGNRGLLRFAPARGRPDRGHRARDRGAGAIDAARVCGGTTRAIGRSRRTSRRCHARRSRSRSTVAGIGQDLLARTTERGSEREGICSG